MSGQYEDFLGQIKPQGLREQLEPLYDGTVGRYSDVRNSLRKFLERLLAHLSTLAGITNQSPHSTINKLADENEIDHQIVPYFRFWWSLASIGSHHQDFCPGISSQTHIDLCRRVAAVCILWYQETYPPLDLTDEMRETWLRDAFSVFGVPYKQVEVCQEDRLAEHLRRDDLLVLNGRAWVGKTCLGSYFVTTHCNKGYIPLIIHENSLMTYRIIPDHTGEKRCNNLRLATNAQAIHEKISSRLLHGDSFIVFLDDPFGHRRFSRRNPLTYLRLADWLDLASTPDCLGSLKVIITTPNQFLGEARESLRHSAQTNPIAKDNAQLLHDQHCFELQLQSYSKDQVLRIVQSAADFHKCNWANKKEWCDLLADVLITECLGFDALHVVCRDLKSASEGDRFLDTIIDVAASADVQEEIKRANDKEKITLSAAYVAEALAEFYRDFAFQTKISFDDICKAGGIVQPAESVSDWLLDNRISTRNFSACPGFRHPEVRAAVNTLAETTMASTLHKMVSNLCRLSDDFSGTALARWEAVHVGCRFAWILNETESKSIYDQMFTRSERGGGDARNVLWAIIGNWNHMRGCPLERYAIGFLKQVPHNYKKLIRPFIWEATENWTDIPREVRLQVLQLTAKGDSLEELETHFSDENTLTFLAAGVSHYNMIQESARSGCDVSGTFLDFMNTFIRQMAKNQRSNYYTSRPGDRLLKQPGSQFESKIVLQKLVDLGRRSGSLDERHPLTLQINDLLEG